MEVEIYIDEEKMETDVSTRIAETKQVNDFLSIGDRETSFTNSFSFPKTDGNKRKLGLTSIPGNTSLFAYRIHKVSIYRRGIQTVSDGIGYLKDSNDRYNLYVYSENIDLFDSILDKSIADLNLTSLNHILNTANWINSFNRSDYTYPIADYGKLEGNTVEVNYQIPALFVKYLWNKIFTEAGFKFKYVGRGGREDYNPFLKDEWNELAISIDEGFPTSQVGVSPELKLKVSKVKVSQFNKKTINQLGNEIVVQEITGEITEYVRFKTDTDPDGIHIFSNSTQYNRSRIRVKENGFYKLTVNGLFYNLNTENASMIIEKDGYNLFTIKDGFPADDSPFGFTNKIYLRAGDEFFVKVVTLAKDNESYYSYDINLELELDNSVTNVNFSSYLSKLKQKDFIKDVLHHYGLIFRRKRDTYELISFEELLDPLAQYANYDAIANDKVYEDWSGKFSKVTNESTKVGNYARNNHFRYLYDNPDDTYGNAILKIDDHTLQNDLTVIERPYKAPDRSTAILNGSQLRKCNFYTKEYNDDGSLKSVKETKGGSYFFRVVKKTGTFKYKLAGALGDNTLNGTYPLMSFDEVDFNNILPNRYAAFSNTLNYGKKFKAEMFLSIIDVHTVDFFKLKYIKQLAGLFYLNKISNFTGTGITDVELIKVRTIEKLGQFSDDYNDDFNT